LSEADRDTALQIGESEIRLSVAAIVGAKECEERGALLDRHDLAVARSPASRCEIAGEHDDLAEEWF